ncbi:hypothetical protein [Pseudofrankia inefficax]|uniref:Uncharacterized protein n=1 Tax=Pseudofrankia inefficax (strain DSM 45817 / CECT 9037 / DDB 130130 / EuI1c) TaxID=298654 RepID=E3JA47_PSEI1|nr:hypothetical protein [Pseudofrankia inefficax]ADP79749.1 hypothetical protein FraEuI1c_1692 [Pseudofrankia inefficax]
MIENLDTNVQPNVEALAQGLGGMALNVARADRIVGLGCEIALALRSHDLAVADLYDDRGLPA